MDPQLSIGVRVIVCERATFLLGDNCLVDEVDHTSQTIDTTCKLVKLSKVNNYIILIPALRMYLNAKE